MAKKIFRLHQVSSTDDLQTICAQMQPDLWAKDNDMSSYQPKNLKMFLEQNGIMLLAYSDDKIAGAAMCYRLPHPSGEDSLYIHELDTHPDFRRQGVATQLMNEVFKIGKELGVYEIWLATETNNDAANPLYKNLDPYEVEQSVTYSYKVK